MKPWIPIAGAGLTAIVANLVGVFFFFKPIAEADNKLLSVHPAIGLLVYVILGLLLFEWTMRQGLNAFKAAAIIAASQFILIVDLMMRGERGFITVLAGGVLLSVTWVSVAYVYSRLGKGRSSGELPN